MTQSASEVRVRRATTDDAAWVASVLRQAFSEYEQFYTEQGYAATTPGASEIVARMGQGPVWVAVHKKQIVGTGSVVPKPEGIYIRGMAVIPSARGLGIGRRLLDEIQRFAIAINKNHGHNNQPTGADPYGRIKEMFCSSGP